MECGGKSAITLDKGKSRDKIDKFEEGHLQEIMDILVDEYLSPWLSIDTQKIRISDESIIL